MPRGKTGITAPKFDDNLSFFACIALANGFSRKHISETARKEKLKERFASDRSKLEKALGVQLRTCNDILSHIDDINRKLDMLIVVTRIQTDGTHEFVQSNIELDYAYTHDESTFYERDGAFEYVHDESSLAFNSKKALCHECGKTFSRTRVAAHKRRCDGSGISTCQP